MRERVPFTSLTRVHVDAALSAGASIELATDRAHYLARVLRLTAGASVLVFNDTDGEFAATVTELSGKRGRLQVDDSTGTRNESGLHSWLIQGLCRSQRMDYCVQKATELGVTRIVPVTSTRGVVRLAPAKVPGRVAHWRAIAIAACEQSGRTRVPAIEAPQSLASLLTRPDLPALAYLDPDEGTGVDHWQIADGAIGVLVGPEGGFSADERTMIAATGAARWRMGPRILRTETAGVVALALLQSRFGDLA